MTVWFTQARKTCSKCRVGRKAQGCGFSNTWRKCDIIAANRWDNLLDLAPVYEAHVCSHVKNYTQPVKHIKEKHGYPQAAGFVCENPTRIFKKHIET